MDQPRTENENRRSQISFASGCNIVIGAWMLISPAVFDYTSPAATWNSVIFGGLVIVFAWIRLASKARAKALRGSWRRWSRRTVRGSGRATPTGASAGPAGAAPAAGWPPSRAAC